MLEMKALVSGFLHFTNKFKMANERPNLSCYLPSRFIFSLSDEEQDFVTDMAFTTQLQTIKHMVITPWVMCASIIMHRCQQGIGVDELCREAEWLKGVVVSLGAHVYWPGKFYPFENYGAIPVFDVVCWPWVVSVTLCELPNPYTLLNCLWGVLVIVVISENLSNVLRILLLILYAQTNPNNPEYTLCCKILMLQYVKG